MGMRSNEVNICVCMYYIIAEFRIYLREQEADLKTQDSMALFRLFPSASLLVALTLTLTNPNRI